MIQSPTSSSNEQIPTEEKLVAILANGPAFVEPVRRTIAKHKLPFTVEEDSEGNGVLTPTISPGELWLRRFITVDEDTKQMKDYARKMSHTQHEVLVTGETGTGKELIAKSMIANREGKVLGVNCAGFPEYLIESELFGHVKGAFTGAERDKIGLMTAAAKGVLFLDEIGELPMSVQAKLLRALQEKKIRRVGSNEDSDISCKFVCATHRDLREMVSKELFRRDLFARISTLELDIKPLRSRLCDLIPITESLDNSIPFLEKHRENLLNNKLDISLNVRSLQQHVIRFHVLGKVSFLK